MIKSRLLLDLTCSIVLYKTEKSELVHVLSCILGSKDLTLKIFLIDNSPTDILGEVASMDSRIEYIFNNANIGYGSGHNIAIRKSDGISKYHLILNADIEFDPKILTKAYDYMQVHQDTSMVSPQIRLPNGTLEYFCRRLPTPFDLIARRFVPGVAKQLFQDKLHNYILYNEDYSKSMNIPNLPGCFMFVRMKALQRVNGFDENFFMYVEDIDLTRKLNKVGKTIYYPEIVIKHCLARGSYKFSKLMVYHIASAIYYFNKWGWFYDPERTKINNAVTVALQKTELKAEKVKVYEIL